MLVYLRTSQGHCIDRIYFKIQTRCLKSGSKKFCIKNSSARSFSSSFYIKASKQEKDYCVTQRRSIYKEEVKFIDRRDYYVSRCRMNNESGFIFRQNINTYLCTTYCSLITKNHIQAQKPRPQAAHTHSIMGDTKRTDHVHIRYCFVPFLCDRAYHTYTICDINKCSQTKLDYF